MPQTSTNFLFLQGIIPRSANEKVTELLVPEAEKAALLKEAENLPSVEISKLDLQWVQVLAEGWASPLSGMYFGTLGCVFGNMVLCLLEHCDLLILLIIHSI